MSITRKFRGKRKDNGEWVEGYLLEQNTPEYHCYIVISFRAEQDNRHTQILECDIYEVIPETVGQYTGLTDKNAKEIFEEDIIDCSYGMFFTVKWDEENARFLGFSIGKERYITYVGREPKSEVIGNIHDNPELLKGGAE